MLKSSLLGAKVLRTITGRGMARSLVWMAWPRDVIIRGVRGPAGFGWRRISAAAVVHQRAAARVEQEVVADDEDEGALSGMVGGGGGEVEAMQELKDMLADPNPANHRPGDVGKVFQLDKQELKELFPQGISGAMHLILFGTRSNLPQNLRRGDDWWNVILKDNPGLIIRKESAKLMSALYCAAKTNTLKGDPYIPTPGFLIDGARGTGKSTVLNHVVHWAVKTGDWIVVYVPHASDLVSGKGFYERSGEHGEFILQPAYALKYLGHMLETNRDKFSDLQMGDTDMASAIQILMEKTLQERESDAMRVFEEVCWLSACSSHIFLGPFSQVLLALFLFVAKLASALALSAKGVHEDSDCVKNALTSGCSWTGDLNASCAGTASTFKPCEGSA